MFKRKQVSFLLTFIYSATWISFSPLFGESDSAPSTYYQNMPASPNSSQNNSYNYRSQPMGGNNQSGKKEVSYIDERDRDIHQRANRMGDWDYKQNWRYNREAFYAGENQPDPYNDETLPYSGGIGRDRDDAYIRMMQQYDQSSETPPQPPNTRPSPNNSR